MSGACFVDISFTDGQSAAWGGALGTSMLLEAAGSLAGAGLAAIEALSPAVIRQSLARGEHPLQRLDALRERAGATPLRAVVNLLPEHGRFDLLDGDLLDAWLRLLARHGIAEVVLVDPLMDMSRLARALRSARQTGLVAVATVPYAEDPSCDEARLAEQAECLAAAGAARVMLRDEAGLLHVDRLATLVPALHAALGATPLDLHTRCHTGLGPQVALEAVRIGVARIDTALACVANGASAPSLPLLLRSAALLGLAVQAPERDRVARADALLGAVADQEGFAASLPWAFDLAPYAHQLPGEVAAEAMQALRQRGRWAGLHAFAHECERVRRDVGAPMLQPFARAIALQALAHLDGAPPYATLQPALRRTVQGVYGELEAIDEALRLRVGRLAAPRPAPPPPDGDDALLALVAGIAPSAVPPRQALRHEALVPEQALVRGLLQRWSSYAALAVTGPGLAIRLEHSKG